MQTAHRRWWEKRLGAGRPIAELEELELDQVANGPRVGRAGPATLRKRLSTLKGALELAHRRRQIPRVPAFPPVLVKWNPRQRFLQSYDDARRLFDDLVESPGPHRAEWYWLALWTCQHASDVERMIWADVDLARGTGLIRNTKNRKVAIRVRLPTPLLAVLRASAARKRPRPEDPIVQPWPSRKATLPLHCRRLGLPELNALDLRHTGLSWAARRLGITPALCRFAGHSSPSMMARAYAHALPPQLEDVTAELESMANDNGGRAPSSQPSTGGGHTNE